MVGRLKEHIQAWRDIGASPMVLEWIENGISLAFEALPGEFHGKNHPGALQHEEFVSAEIDKLVACGAVKKCEPGVVPKVVSPLNAVPKKGKVTLRLVIDMRYVNSFIKAQKFKYEGHKNLSVVLERDDWIFTLDLKSGYHHLYISIHFWTYFGFCWKGVYYYYVVLPFGLTTAPFIFTKTVKQIIRFWRIQLIRNMSYIDDFLFGEKSQQKAIILEWRVVSDLTRLGWVIEWDKSMSQPAQKAISLGLEIDTVAGTLLVPKDKRDKLFEAISWVLKQNAIGKLTVREVARAVGRLVSMTAAVAPVRWCTIHLYRCMNKVLYNGVVGGPNIFRYTKGRWDDRIVLSVEAVAELEWWLRNFDHHNGKGIWLPTEVGVITTDASHSGWGAWCGDLRAGGYWDDTETQMSQNCREMMGVYNALRVFTKLYSGRL